MSPDNSVTILLKEYDTLRAEIRELLQRAWNIRLALFSSFAVIFGISVLGKGGSLSPVAFAVPFLLLVLCQFGVVTIRDAHFSVSIKSIHIQERIEKHPSLSDYLTWERTCPDVYEKLRSSSVFSVVRQEPIPWLSLSIPFLAYSLLASDDSSGYVIRWCYFLAITVLYVFLVVEMYFFLPWPDQATLKERLSSDGIYESTVDQDVCC